MAPEWDHVNARNRFQKSGSVRNRLIVVGENRAALVETAAWAHVVALHQVATVGAITNSLGGMQVIVRATLVPHRMRGALLRYWHEELR